MDPAHSTTLSSGRLSSCFFPSLVLSLALPHLFQPPAPHPARGILGWGTCKVAEAPRPSSGFTPSKAGHTTLTPAVGEQTTTGCPSQDLASLASPVPILLWSKRWPESLSATLTAKQGSCLAVGKVAPPSF